MDIPVSFYNVNNNVGIIASHDYLKIKLAGKRSDLELCKDLAFHIDAQSLTQKPQLLIPTSQDLFLPPQVKLVYCKPLNVSLNHEH